MCYNDYGDAMSPRELDTHYFCYIIGDGNVASLPSKKDPKFNQIMDYIISKLNEDLELQYELYEEATSEHEREVSLNEINDLLERLSFCEDYLYEDNQSYLNQRMIFAKTQAENYYVLRDLKAIDQEHFRDLLNILSFISSGDRTNNPTKVKILSANRNRQGVLDYKSGQVRLYAKEVGNGIIYVFGIFIKKDNWNKKLGESIDQRIANTAKEFELLKLASGEYIESLLAESVGVLEEILGKIKKVDSLSSGGDDEFVSANTRGMR